MCRRGFSCCGVAVTGGERGYRGRADGSIQSLSFSTGLARDREKVEEKTGDRADPGERTLLSGGGVGRGGGFIAETWDEAGGSPVIHILIYIHHGRCIKQLDEGRKRSLVHAGATREKESCLRLIKALEQIYRSLTAHGPCLGAVLCRPGQVRSDSSKPSRGHRLWQSKAGRDSLDSYIHSSDRSRYRDGTSPESPEAGRSVKV